MKKVIQHIVFVFIMGVALSTSVAHASYYPRSAYVDSYYNNTVHSDNVYYGQHYTSRANYIRSYQYTGNVNVIYQPYPVYYDVPVYYPVYQKPKPVCYDYRRGARYYEESDQGPNCSDRIEDWNNEQGLPNYFLASLYGTDNY